MDKKEQKHKENKSQVLKHGKPHKFQASVTILCARTALFACLMLLSRPISTSLACLLTVGVRIFVENRCVGMRPMGA